MRRLDELNKAPEYDTYLNVTFLGRYHAPCSSFSFMSFSLAAFATSPSLNLAKHYYLIYPIRLNRDKVKATILRVRLV